MPVTLPPLTRRRFLGAVAVSAGVLAVRPALGRSAGVDPHRVALVADTHVPEAAGEVSRGCDMADRLKRVAAEIAALDPKPACAVVDGDLAYKTGTAAEYALLGRLVEPVRAAGVPLHLALGNHDHFGRFAAGLDALRPKERPVDGEQVLVVELERANLFVLDSHDPGDPVGGRLGRAQVKWLTEALDARRDKPAVVFVHHPLEWEPGPEGKWHGLADSVDLWPVLKERKQVKAYVFGHTHTWRLAERDGIHLINLPAVAYPFAKDEVTGWVDLRLAANGAKLEVRSLDPAHPKHGQMAELAWRKG